MSRAKNVTPPMLAERGKPLKKKERKDFKFRRGGKRRRRRTRRMRIKRRRKRRRRRN